MFAQRVDGRNNVDGLNKRAVPPMNRRTMAPLAKVNGLLRSLDRSRTGDVAIASGRLLDRVRGLFLVFTLLNGAMVIVQLPAAGGTPWLLRAVAAVGVAFTGWWFIAARRLGHFKAAWDVGLAIALCAAAIGVGEPLRALGLFYGALYLRSFYGSALRVGAAAFYSFMALAVAVELTPAAGTAGVVSPDVLSQLPSFAFSAAITYLLTRTLSAHERRAVRQSILTRTGSALLASSERDEVHRIATATALELVDDLSARSTIGTLDDAQMVHCVAAAGANTDGVVGIVVPLDMTPAGYQQVIADCRPFTVTDVDRATLAELAGIPDRGGSAFFAPLMVEGRAGGTLSVDCAVSLPADTAEHLALLAAETSLALERLLVAERLRASEERFRSVVQSASDMVAIVAADGLRYVSPAIETVLGYAPDDFDGWRGDIVHPDDIPRVVAAIAEVRSQPHEASLELQYRARHADGSWREVETVATNLHANPAIDGILLTTRDVTDRRRLEAELRHQAFHDALTGLPNRALLTERLDHALARARRRPDSSLTLLFLDLDDFKVINDSVGHTAGDELLMEVGKRLAGCVRADDTCARLAGDEFAILLEDADVAAGERLAERLLEALGAPLQVAGRCVTVRASIGIATSSGDVGGDELLANADMAMYASKRSPDRCRVFQHTMRTAAGERLALREDLADALARDEFELHYQPIVELRSGDVLGAEALLRWRHPQRGIVPPLDFVGLAEQTGLIVPIGQWVLAEAVRQTVAWEREGVVGPEFRIGVNVSARQLQDGGFVQGLERVLQETGLDARRLVLELTESVLLVESAETVARLDAARALGAEVAIDDFGTGYSALSYLGRLPIDTIKIDKSFIQSEPGAISPLVTGIVLMATGLGLRVVAEGVEEPAQAEQLVAAGCRLGQGFLYSRPVEPAAFALAGARQQ
jgi:diguanylate cyclase (GGDEF)-like protein/PAS domain S-box-containing protein